MQTMEIGAFEAKNRLSELLGQAERGQRIYITRRGRRIAMLTAVQERRDLPAHAELVGKFAAFRKAAKRGPESLKELLEEGR
jgi:prevent-host-death family protein